MFRKILVENGRKALALSWKVLSEKIRNWNVCSIPKSDRKVWQVCNESFDCELVRYHLDAQKVSNRSFIAASVSLKVTQLDKYLHTRKRLEKSNSLFHFPLAAFCTIIKYQLWHFGHAEKSLRQKEELDEKLFHYLIFCVPYIVRRKLRLLPKNYQTENQ